MEYLVDGTKYSLSYSDLRDRYNEFVALTDQEFMERISEALHLACVIAYLKEIPNEWIVSDKGIIHEMIHLIHIGEDPLVNLQEIRESFKEMLKLA